MLKSGVKWNTFAYSILAISTALKGVYNMMDVTKPCLDPLWTTLNHPWNIQTHPSHFHQPGSRRPKNDGPFWAPDTPRPKNKPSLPNLAQKSSEGSQMNVIYICNHGKSVKWSGLSPSAQYLKCSILPREKLLHTYLSIKTNLSTMKRDEILKQGFSEPQNVNDTFYIHFFIILMFRLALEQKQCRKMPKNT